MNQVFVRTVVLLGILSCVGAGGDNGKQVRLLKTPHAGIQPQALVDSKGTVHLIYFKDDAGAGDLYDVGRGGNDSLFSKPMQVNSQAGSAIATGTIRGGRLSLGKNNRV